MRGLLLIGVVSFVSALDCSGVAPWRAQIYAAGGSQVHHNGQFYVNSWYATETDSPLGGDPWVLRGQCDAGTAGEVYVNCDSAAQWTGGVYSGQSQVVYNGYRYVSQWYADGGDVPGEAVVWSQQGLCDGSVPPVTAKPVATPLPTAAPATTKYVYDRSTALAVSSQAPITAPITAPPATARQTTLGSGSGNIDWPGASASLQPGLLNWPAQTFAPYMDVCLSARPNLSSINAQTGTKFYVLAFVVGSGSCQPSWGGYYSLAQGPYSTFESDINTLRSLGGDVVVSMGGALGPELADIASCQGANAVANLKSAYDAVINKYKLTHIDFDIEGAAVSSGNRNTGWANRFQALKQIQEERPYLKIWWTLPILTDGLTYDGQLFLQDLMKSGVRFDRFNVMTMDYGSWYSSGKTMHQCEQQAIDALASQMLSTATSLGLATQYGWKSASDVYPILGSTPMIGVNDVNTEIYTLADARNSLAVWKSSKPIGLLSQWSIARDIPCSGDYAQATCSSGNVQSQSYEFAGVFAQIHSS